MQGPHLGGSRPSLKVENGTSCSVMYASDLVVEYEGAAIYNSVLAIVTPYQPGGSSRCLKHVDGHALDLHNSQQNQHRKQDRFTHDDRETEAVALEAAAAGADSVVAYVL